MPYYLTAPQSPMHYDGQLNLRKYFNDVVAPDQNPDWIIIHLDVNDYCAVNSLNGSSLSAINAYSDAGYAVYTRPLIDSIRAVAPDAKIGISYTPYPSANEQAFQLAYGANALIANRLRWRLIVSRLRYLLVGKVRPG